MDSEQLFERRCSFCARGKDSGMETLIGSKITAVHKTDGRQYDNVAAICKDCAEHVFLMHTRMEELLKQAGKISDDRFLKYGKRDPDGDCTCQTCVYQALVDKDAALKELERQHQFIAQEVPTTMTVQ